VDITKVIGGYFQINLRDINGFWFTEVEAALDAAAIRDMRRGTYLRKHNQCPDVLL
jgi:hypothetical protein